MTNHLRLTIKQKVDIINAYNDELVPMITLAERYGISRQAVYKILKKSGSDTTKGTMLVSCSACGKEIERPKCKIRKQANHFCNNEC